MLINLGKTRHLLTRTHIPFYKLYTFIHISSTTPLGHELTECFFCYFSLPFSLFLFAVPCSCYVSLSGLGTSGHITFYLCFFLMPISPAVPLIDPHSLSFLALPSPLTCPLSLFPTLCHPCPTLSYSHTYRLSGAWHQICNLLMAW